MQQIAFSHASFSYTGPAGKKYPALRNVDLSIQAGEFVAVIGANGSGKTTLVRHVNGLLVPDKGNVTVDGLSTHDPHNLSEIRRRVGMVFQQPEDQIVATTVEDDVAFGLENLGLPKSEVERRVEGTLAAFDLLDLRERPPYLLSAGQMQRTALAGMLAVEPGCIILDEPTAMLDPRGRQELLTYVQRLHRTGTTIILITHDMNEAMLAERIVVMQAGRIVLDGSPHAVLADPDQFAALDLELPTVPVLVNALRKRFPNLSYPVLSMAELLRKLPDGCTLGPQNSGERGTIQDTPALIEAVGLAHTYMEGTPFVQQALSDVSLTVGAGTVMGLAGVNGSGKSTLLQHLNGLYRPQKGILRVGPYDLADAKLNVRSVRQFVGLVFQVPEDQFFNQYVGDEVAYAPRQFALAGVLKIRVRDAMQLAGLDFAKFKDRPIFTLSGGEKRKAALAAVLAADPAVLALDEPTAGLDPAARREIRGVLRGWKQHGRTVVISSQNMDDLLALCDDLVVMAAGWVALSGKAGEVMNRGGRLRQAGLEQPLILQFLVGLRRKGWRVQAGLVDVDEVLEAIKELHR